MKPMTKTLFAMPLFVVVSAFASSPLSLVVTNDVQAQIPYYSGGVEHYNGSREPVPLNIYLDGHKLGAIFQGKATFELPSDFYSAKHVIAYSFGGAYDVNPATDDVKITFPFMLAASGVQKYSAIVGPITVGYPNPNGESAVSSMRCGNIQYSYSRVVSGAELTVSDPIKNNFCEIL